MKHIVSTLVEKITDYSTKLNPYIAKYEAKNVFDLSKKAVGTEDASIVTDLIARRDELVSLCNVIQSKYTVGGFEETKFTTSVLNDSTNEDKMRRMVYSTSDVVLDGVKRYSQVTFDGINSMSISTVLDTAMGCLMANELELALAGILYVLYQDKVELTNIPELKRKAEAEVETLTTSIESGTIDTLEITETQNDENNSQPTVQPAT